ncbi:type IV pilus twitching motility protein PilT [Legionella feeleii]|uniref:Twitching motility protein PilT n=1 Tax=Legionella feeleii TaxID=453 RepID=A0A0W0TK84_9GAMM|nr:type IV pilus twitching motility protein PilT [Legionella feeleii]KTC95917.1 twitching motility protein PilT [Legionella feeleii]SPX60324.1 twitching motility protein PilT [Legionella feeleii]
MDIRELLIFAVDNNASDLHLSAGLPPVIRVDGTLHQTTLPVLEQPELSQLLSNTMTTEQRNDYRQNKDIDFAFEIADQARFRANVFHQARGAGAVFRVIPSRVPSMAELELPPIFTEIAFYSRGLILITGPTGSGKSTTAAALIDHINTVRSQHILTIEDPIEFIHQSKKCLVNQRQVRRDTISFHAALRSALREDPDVILVGELRDLETIRLAMTAAETGHLVFATLHTNSAVKAIHRIIDVFPGVEKSLARSMLAESLQAVIAQNLLPKIKGGRIAAFEIMLCNTAIRNLIREDKLAQMYSSMQTGQAKGMQTLEQHLKQLWRANLIAAHHIQEGGVYLS